MVCILLLKRNKFFLFTVITVLASFLFIFTVSAAVGLFSSAIDPVFLSDGVYNIVNCSTGQYLDVYDMVYEPTGKAYLSAKSGESGQDFLIKRQDDGTYIIYPQSENGLYSLSYEFDIMEGEFISKKDQVSNQSKFNIIPTNYNENYISYTVKPACMSDDMLSLGLSGVNGSYGFPLAGLKLNDNSPACQWQFIRVSSASLSIPCGYVNVKQGDYYDINELITPRHLIGNMVWESSDPEIATVDKYGIVYGASDGTAVITVSCGNQTAYTTVRVSSFTAYTWYSQHNTYSGGWDAVSLKNLYFTTFAGTKKLFFVDGYKTADDWMDLGCKLCSEAMILHNMGAKLVSGYDFRTDETDMLDADPYTVALANAGLSGVNVQSVRAANNPVLVNHHLINPRFTVNGKAITTQEFHGNNLKHIKELLDVHPEGVVVGMYNSSRDTTHYVVFTECLNPDDPNGNYEFRICDAAASVPELGDNVPFKESISYVSLGYGYWSIFEYSVYNIVE